MGKHGPCCHCGVPSSPLWRNGPPDKPILCNACGSRWRTKGSLTNYTPLHSRTEPGNLSNQKAPRIKIVTSRDKELNFLKRKQTYNNIGVGNIASNYSDDLWKVFKDDTSNRSSSGSAVSDSGNYAQFDSTYVNELTGFPGAFAFEADRMNPAKKRASIPHPKSSSIATLTKDLCTILHQQQSSGFYRAEEDDLLFDTDKSILTSETGLGSYLIMDTNSATWEEDSEASSFSIDNKPYIGSETVARVSNYVGTQHVNSERINKLSEILENSGSRGLQLKGVIDQKDVSTDHEKFGRDSLNEGDSQLPTSFQSLSGSTDIVDNFSTFSEEVFNASLSKVRSTDYNSPKRLEYSMTEAPKAEGKTVLVTVYVDKSQDRRLSVHKRRHSYHRVLLTPQPASEHEVFRTGSSKKAQLLLYAQQKRDSTRDSNAASSLSLISPMPTNTISNQPPVAQTQVVAAKIEPKRNTSPSCFGDVPEFLKSIFCLKAKRAIIGKNFQVTDKHQFIPRALAPI